MQNNKLTIIALSLPLLLILVVVVVSYWPASKVTTDYNFLYAQCENNSVTVLRGYSCTEYLQLRYSIKNNQLIVNEVRAPYQPQLIGSSISAQESFEQIDGTLYVYDTQAKTKTEITLEEAQSYRYTGLNTSPDGAKVEVLQNRSRGFFIFYNYEKPDVYLTKGDNRTELNIFTENDNYYYYPDNNFQFIGWIDQIEQ